VTTFQTLPACIAKIHFITVSEKMCLLDKNDVVNNLMRVYILGFTVEHACHVTMAVDKLMKRIVNPNIDVDGYNGNIASHLYDYTHGIVCHYLLCTDSRR
jgi:hypothetical protein